MNTAHDHGRPRFVHALRTQPKTAHFESSDALPCPYCTNNGRMFLTDDQLFDHARDQHAPLLHAMDPSHARATVKDAALKLKAVAEQSSQATAGGGSAIGIGDLSLESGKHSPLGKKRPAETEFQARRGKAQGPVPVQILDPDHSRDLPRSMVSPGFPLPKPAERRFFDPKQGRKDNAPPSCGTPEPRSEWSMEANRSQMQTPQPLSSPGHSAPLGGREGITDAQEAPNSQRQPGIPEIRGYDPRYPALLLQPDSRPITQEQLASEVKSIYAGLTLVETKCIHVDRAQHLAAQENKPEVKKFAPDHWQALIALHRTLLHEHHDFFLASQHPSASPALKRLPAKYSMPARMWKHGIHSFLELLRFRLPESMDYMLAFNYLAYQMMALLYETVPAFEDTWIECLGDLGRYRMAIEDENIRDREIWAGVARSWYSKAADRNPTVGRLYHHLAILARPNALQQLYYYARSLTCVRPFGSARESILTLFEPVAERSANSDLRLLPIDMSFIWTHAILFGRSPLDNLEKARIAFLEQLNNHIGRVTAKWKEQGVYVGVTNIAGLFDYGRDDSPLRQVLLVHAEQAKRASGKCLSPPDDDANLGASVDNQPVLPSIKDDEVPSNMAALETDARFQLAKQLTWTTLSIVLKRMGDKNVLPHVHVLLSFIYSFTTIPYVSRLVDDAPWPEIAAFLNVLCKSERADQINHASVFHEGESVPLPEDYLIRGQLWCQWYFPENWFPCTHDEEDRNLELASTVKLRTQRVMNLGYHISALNRWISYDPSTHTFSLVS